MNKWVEELINHQKTQAMPILTFPGVQKAGINIAELINSSENMARVMKLVNEETPESIASLAFMDLSVEAEAFGAPIILKDNEIPTIGDPIVTSLEEAQNLVVPKVGTKRTSLAIETIKKAKELITNKPVFAGAIGSYSLTGRLVGVTDALINCYEEPEMMHEVLKKTTEFLIDYIKELKAAGADGVVIAEPLAGLLSPDLAKEFSSIYIKQIVDAVQDDTFIVIYHNCGNSVPKLIDTILSIGAKALHFGNAIDMTQIIEKIPKNILVMGNIDPAGEFASGSQTSIYEATVNLLNKLGKYPNFVLSSGCDIPAHAKWENIHSFYKALEDFNRN